MIKVPMADLYQQYLSIKDEIDDAIEHVIKDSAFIQGPRVKSFEQLFAKSIRVDHCVSCGNGTDALYIALHALGVRPEDEIICPAFSWISTSEVISQIGAKIVFCDIDLETFTIDPKKIEEKISKKTVGIIPVHLYGHPANMNSIMNIARLNGLWVLEDCAQAYLATINNKEVGTIGDAGTFSFYPGKNLGAMGDAGAIVSNNHDLITKMTMYARHGGLTKGDHQVEGINSRLDGLQAAILKVKLTYIKDWTQSRQKRAQRYSEILKDLNNLKLPGEAKGSRHVWHLYVVMHKKRDALASYLNDRGVQSSINYPVALPFLSAYRRYQHRHEDFPNAYTLQNSCLSLPIFPEMTDLQQDYVAESIKEFCSRN